MFIEVTKEEAELVMNFRKRKNDEQKFKNSLENYKKTIIEMQKIILSLDDYLNDDDFFDIFRKECNEEVFDALKDIVCDTTL